MSQNSAAIVNTSGFTASDWVSRASAPGGGRATYAAEQHELVNINENTSAAAAARRRSGARIESNPLDLFGKATMARRVRCNTDIKLTSRTSGGMLAQPPPP